MLWLMRQAIYCIKSTITHHMPRTTLTLEKDVYQVAKRYAAARGVRLGKAVTELVRRGLAARETTRMKNGLAVFDLPTGSPAVTGEDVRRVEGD
jgi:hypothetical protein